MAQKKQTKAEPQKKGKKSKGAAEEEVAVAKTKFVKKRKRNEIEWLIFPIIVVIALIVLFIVKIAVEFINFSREVSSPDAPTNNVQYAAMILPQNSLG